MYDALTTRYTFACPERGEARVALSAFRRLDAAARAGAARRSSRSSSAAPAATSIPGLVAHDELDWAPLGLGGDATFVNLMTATRRPGRGRARRSRRAAHPGRASGRGASSATPEERPRPVFPSAFLVLAPRRGERGRARRPLPGLRQRLDQPRQRRSTSTCRSTTTARSASSRTCSPHDAERVVEEFVDELYSGQLRQPPPDAAVATVHFSPSGYDRRGGGAMYGLTRGTITLLGAGVAGLLVWLATQVDETLDRRLLGRVRPDRGRRARDGVLADPRRLDEVGLAEAVAERLPARVPAGARRGRVGRDRAPARLELVPRARPELVERHRHPRPRQRPDRVRRRPGLRRGARLRLHVRHVRPCRVRPVRPAQARRGDSRRRRGSSTGGPADRARGARGRNARPRGRARARARAALAPSNGARPASFVPPGRDEAGWTGADTTEA